MFENVFLDEKAKARYQGLRFGPDIDGFLNWMESEGYSRRTRFKRFTHLSAFSRYLEACNISSLEYGAESVAMFVRHEQRRLQQKKLKQAHKVLQEANLAVLQFLSYLQATSDDRPLVRVQQSAKSPPPFQEILDRFLESLRSDQALAEATIAYYEFYTRRFLSFVHTDAGHDWAGLKFDVIQAYLNEQAGRSSRRTMHCVCYALKSFLRFLIMEGCRLPPGIDGFPAPRIYRYERPPLFLSPSQVQRIFDAVDRRRKGGVRDYAILMLLAVYGMRGAEVAGLRLDDLDWKLERIHLKGRKSGHNDRYPLSQVVGESIIEYLQKARPKSRHRELFLTINAPIRPLRRGHAISDIVRRRMIAAGVHVRGRRGSHLFRYTCAHQLVSKDVPHKVISDYLGHRSVAATSGYIQVDLEQLRQVAQNDGEDLL